MNALKKGDRIARRRRRALRVLAARTRLGQLRSDRLSPIVAVLRAYRTRATEGPMLKRYVERVRSEVESIEKQNIDLTSPAPETVRRTALDLLAGFGWLSALDFSVVPEAEQPMVRSLLGLEYRWCMAAAGTNKSEFRKLIGRTGAR